MEKDILVSYVIPAYNAEKDIVNCIESIRSIKRVPIEIIVVDDGSVDDTLKHCSKVKDKRLRIISQKNQGVSEARNHGIHESRGEYVAFVDADDMICAEEMEKIFLDITKEEDMVMFAYLYRSKRSDIKMVCPLKEDIYTSEGARKLSDKLLDVSVYKNQKGSAYGARVWQYLFKKDFLSRYSLLFEKDLPYAEDLCFCLAALKNCQSLRVYNRAAYIYQLNFQSAGRRYRENIWKELKLAADKISQVQEKENVLLYTAYGKTAIKHYCLNLPLKNYGKMKKKVSEVISDKVFLNAWKQISFENKTFLERLEEGAAMKGRTNSVVRINILKSLILRVYYYCERGKRIG